MTPSRLFRRQVADARRDNWLGQAQLVQPMPVRLIVWTCVGFVGAAVAFTAFGTYTRRVHAEGVLSPNSGLMTLTSPRAGRVGSSAVREGDRVEKGQLLYTIDVDAVSASGPTQARIITQLSRQKESVERERAARAALAVIEKKSLQEQLDNSLRQSREFAEQISLQSKLEGPVKDRTDELSNAVGKGLARASDFQNQNYLYLQANTQLAQFKQASLQLDGKIGDLRSQIEEFDDKLARDLAEFDRSAARLDQQIAESEAQRAIEIRAPERGILTSIQVHAGQQIATGGALLTLLPSAGRLQANLYVDSSAIGFVEKGEAVMLRYAAFPFQRFGLYRGSVVEVTHAPLDAPGQPTPGGTESKSVIPGGAGIYRIIVRPDRDQIIAYGEAKSLEAGMRVEADIALEKRPIYRWLLDPVSHLRHSAALVTGGPR
ncbi:MAG: HlyD family efflux transporter periplasmic adaptor subunit [Beijerinckiaceae bacterium]|nr:HlyD family efflux transporter periplasmic adaptor subunit [Beijerinckiaceae bacterium]